LFESEIAQQLNLDCDTSPRQIKPHADEDMMTLTSPFDATCALAAFKAGSDAQNTCSTSNDQDGVACSWCLTANLCLSHDQMDLAKTAVKRILLLFKTIASMLPVSQQAIQLEKMVKRPAK
jgi:hypothetical protein